MKAEEIHEKREVEWRRGGRSLHLRDPAGSGLEVASPGVRGIDERAVFASG